MPTTTMAVSNPPTSTTVTTTQVSSLMNKDDDAAVTIIIKESGEQKDEVVNVNGSIGSQESENNNNGQQRLFAECSDDFHSPITSEADKKVSANSPTDVNSSLLNFQATNSPTTEFSSNGHLLMAQNSSLNFQAASSPTDSPWSIGDENSSGSGGFVNYSSPNNGQAMHKRPIMSQQQQLHHTLSPNSSLACNSASQQQQQQYNIHYKNNGNTSGNNFSAWSNHSGPTSPWQQQQQMQQLLQSTSSSSSSQIQSSWNRGRSAPNLNPLSPHIMQQQHQRKHQNATQFSMPSSASSLQQHQQQQGSPNLTSPSKYRRSTSYPGKNQMHAFPMDVGNMIDDPYMNYQDRNTMDMRSLEHCLNDITNTAGVQSDLKGECSFYDYSFGKEISTTNKSKSLFIGNYRF
ncbi:hypothetical protein PVAND_000288 [Polypedilum vanderplanki]|uniref:Uncharacterized protein n=1 Tax=Polypedilum vanderplanki TaxID=319348 RepID=A0A9J6BJW1_POLVA|nr:hypothetical protein PVAND_000288 [Polypedilum vanderplanki]